MWDNIKLINRITYLISGVAIFILLFSFVDYVVRTCFIIERVTIIGNMSHMSAKQFSVVIQNNLQGNLFTLNISALQNKFRVIPWVKDVEVSRQFPDGITVDISEYEALARLNDDDGLVTPTGQIFAGAVGSSTLAIFNIPLESVHNVVDNYNSMLPILHKHQIALVRLTENGTGITRLEFSNNLQVTICGASLVQQIELLDKYWDKLYTVNPNLKTINMCYKNALAINGTPLKVESFTTVLNKN